MDLASSACDIPVSSGGASGMSPNGAGSSIRRVTGAAAARMTNPLEPKLIIADAHLNSGNPPAVPSRAGRRGANQQVGGGSLSPGYRDVPQRLEITKGVDG